MSRRGFPKHESALELVAGAWRNSSGAITSSYNFSAGYDSYSADSVGPNTPGWPSVRAENGYSAYESKTSMSSSHWTGFTSSGDQGGGTWPMSWITSISDLPNYFIDQVNQAEQDAYYKCLNKLISSIKNQKVNVANFAGEFKQTCNTVASAANRIGNAFLEVKRGNLRGALNVLSGGSGGSRGGGSNSHGGRKRPVRKPPRLPSTGSFANDWLSLRYGWIPLLSDVNGACEELANRLTYQPDVYTAEASGKSGVALRNVTLQQSGLPPVIYSGDVRYTVKGVIKYRARAEWADIARTTGLLNPLATAWELLPYSFVVDWFVPVGNFLNNLDYDLGIEFSRGWIVTKASHTFRGVVVSGLVPGPANQSWSGGSQVTSVRGYRRDILGGFPNVPAPRFKDPISLGHVENALALLRQRFS